jgi:hypothetical protein
MPIKPPAITRVFDRFPRSAVIGEAPLKRLIAFTFVTLLFSGTTTIAQQRVPNSGSQPILRHWPMTGVWQVALARLVDGNLGCAFMTGVDNQATGDHYLWGFRTSRAGFVAMIVDNNETSSEGDSLRIFVDRIQVGAFRIDKVVNTHWG